MPANSKATLFKTTKWTFLIKWIVAGWHIKPAPRVTNPIHGYLKSTVNDCTLAGKDKNTTQNVSPTTHAAKFAKTLSVTWLITYTVCHRITIGNGSD